MRTLIAIGPVVLLVGLAGCGPAAVPPKPSTTPLAVVRGPIWIAACSPDNSRTGVWLAAFTSSGVVPKLQELPRHGEVKTTKVDQFGMFDNLPAILIVLSAAQDGPSSEEVWAKLAGLPSDPGHELFVVLDESTDSFLTVTVELPESASSDRTTDLVRRISKTVLSMPGTAHTLAFRDQDQSNQATLLVKRAGPEPSPVQLEAELNRKFPEAKCTVTEKTGKP